MKKELPFYLLIVLIFSLLIGAYSNHFNNPFQFDDAHTIVNNNAIRSLKNIPHFFKDARTISSLPANQIYRPGLTTLNAIDYWIGGQTEPVPFYYHVSIFISYILLGILLYFLFLKIFGQAVEHKWNKYFALAGAGFYSLHTANAETVNYVIARSDSFSTLMLILSFVIYLYKPQWRNKFIYLLPVIIGFFVKEPTIMIAPLLFIYIILFEYKFSVPEWFTGKGIKSMLAVVLRLLPLFIVILALFVLSKSMVSNTYVPGGRSQFAYIITQPIVIVHYFNNFILPVDLSADTDWLAINSISDIRVLLGFLFLISFICLAVFCSTKQLLRPVAFGIIWFLLALLPTSVVPLAEVLNDHRTFFPYIGLAFAATWLVGIAIIKFQDRIEHVPAARLVAVVLPLLLLTAHAYGTHHRNKVWSSSESLWYDVTVKSPNNGRGLMNYGVAKMGQGDYTTALDCFDRAIRLLPTYSYLYVNKAVAEAATGKTALAEDDYKKALAFDNANPECYYFYATFLKSQKRYKEALEQANNGLKVSADHIGNKTLSVELTALVANQGNLVETAEQSVKNAPTVENYLNLSLLYYQNGLYEKCIDAANSALKLKPDYVEAYNNICSAQSIIGNYDEAVKAGQKAISIKPDYQLAKNNLADASSRKAKVDKLMQIIGKQPNADNYINLSLLYYNLGSFRKCAEAAEKALTYNANSDLAYNNICTAYNMLKQWDKAIDAGQKGLKINPKNELLKNNLNVSIKGKAGEGQAK